jgi:predicted O-linked N-acetylglucosamine transferase (SPINDLY family)
MRTVDASIGRPLSAGHGRQVASLTSGPAKGVAKPEANAVGHANPGAIRPREYNRPMQSGPKMPAAAARAGAAPLLGLAAKLDEARALHEQQRLTEAQGIYEEVLKLIPAHFHALHMLGVIAGQKYNPKRAAELIGRALESDPANKAACAAHMNMALAFLDLGKFDSALASYDRAIAIDPANSDAHNNRGMVLEKLRRMDAALASYDRAIAINPKHADAHLNRGSLLRELRRLEAAVESFERAIELNPHIKFAHGIRDHTRMQLCRWEGLETARAQLRESLSNGLPTSSPFFVVALSDSAPLQRRAAEIRVREKCPPRRELGNISKRPSQQRIRVGYFSADFHNHATMYLMAELFERHDRSKVDLTMFSFGPDADDAMRKRLRRACQEFVDVRQLSDLEAAKLARKRKIDVAVDLKGFTQDNRAGIFALRAAPLQVSFLGYPGTMGAEYMDYLVGDATLIPTELQSHYTEKIVYLPDSYQPNDRTRKVADKQFTRDELDLPQAAFVFCCFNNSYKVTPEVFDCWMRILRRVDGSVLWLLEDNPAASNNLRREASSRAVDPNRLVFAPRTSLPEHLARHRAADLFLDTFTFNAHTTASDALWAGVPVLTLIGEAFAARVAASLVKAVGLAELVTSTVEHYETTAIALAVDATRLADIKRRLAVNLRDAPLFDAKRFAKHLEQAYRIMYDRYQQDLPPEHIYVAGAPVENAN